MRLDLFLKQSRLVRRRTLADALCRSFRVRLNDHVAKAASRVRPGDVLEIDFGDRRVVARVLRVPEEPGTFAENTPLVEVIEIVRG